MITYVSLGICIFAVVLAVLLIPGLSTLFEVLLERIWFIMQFVFGFIATVGLAIYVVLLVNPVLKKWFLKLAALLLVGALAICVNIGIYCAFLGPELLANNVYNESNMNGLAGMTIGVYLLSYFFCWLFSN